MSNTLPWRTLATPDTPSDFSAPSIALPCGSRMPDLRVTVTRAFIFGSRQRPFVSGFRHRNRQKRPWPDLAPFVLGLNPPSGATGLSKPESLQPAQPERLLARPETFDQRVNAGPPLLQPVLADMADESERVAAGACGN